MSMESQIYEKDKVTKAILKCLWGKYFTTHNISGCNTHA